MTHRTAPALLVAALLTLAGGWAGPAARGAGEPTPSSTPGVAVAAAGLPPVATLPVEQFNVVVEKTNAYTAALNVAQEVHRAHDVYTATVKPEPIPPEIIAKVKAATVLVPKSPMLPTADAAVGELEASLEILVPNLQREVELNGGKRSKGDGGKTGREVSSAQTITSFERFFAAETALRAAVAEVRPLVERRQLAVGEQARGRDLGWHVRGVLGAVKPLVELIPATPPPPNRPPMDPRLYAARLADLDAAWTALDTYANAHPPEVAALPDGVALRGDLGALVAAARQLRPALEAKKLDQAAIGKRINELINRYNAAVKRVNAAALPGTFVRAVRALCGRFPPRMSSTTVDPNIEDQLLEEELAQRPMDGSLLRRLLSYLWPYRRAVVGTVAGVTLAVASQLLGPRFIQYGVDHYLTNFTTPAAATRGIALVSGVYLLNLLVGWGAGVLRVRACVAAGQGALRDLRAAIFKHVQRLSLNYFDRTHQGRIIARADTDITAIEPILEDGTHQALGSVLTLVGVVAFMLHYDWRLFLAVALVLPPLAVATVLFQRHGMRAYREVRRYSSRLTAALAENISGVRVVQAFAREDRNRDRFAGMHAAYGERAYDAATVFHTYFPFLGLMSGMGSVIILGYGGTLALRGEITAGELAAFLMYLGMFFGPVQTMGELYNQALSSAAGAERIFQLLDERPQVRDATDAVTLPPLRGEVAFEDVSFRYDTTPVDRWILENVSLRAPAGATVALVGQTGSGKTSIVSLLARFYEPQRGRILVDGMDLRRATAESLREQIGIVTQENFLFSGTVMENLRFGRPDASDDEVFEAARTLGTDEMIRGLDAGYDTTVAERGGNFSAGERQLLCFTRAMVARPRILILDEATSAVDPGTETIIQHALERLFARRTSFVIAHRLSTIRHADEILVMADGRIVERGTHEELLDRPEGEYRKLHAEFSQH